MEAIKGFVFDRGPKELMGIDCHSYLVSFVLVTDEPLENLDENETIIMGAFPASLLTPALQSIGKYKVPNKTLGDANNAIVTVSKLSPKDLKPVKAKNEIINRQVGKKKK